MLKRSTLLFIVSAATAFLLGFSSVNAQSPEPVQQDVGTWEKYIRQARAYEEELLDILQSSSVSTSRSELADYMGEAFRLTVDHDIWATKYIKWDPCYYDYAFTRHNRLLFLSIVLSSRYIELTTFTGKPLERKEDLELLLTDLYKIEEQELGQVTCLTS